MWLSSITLLPWPRGFPPQAFPITISSLTSPRSVSLQSTAALALGSLHTPQTLAPSPCAFQGTLIPVRGMYICSKDCLILVPLRLPWISCFPLRLKCFSSDSDNYPDVGIGPLLQFPHPPRAGPVLLTLLFSPLIPSSYWVLHGSIYSFPLVRYSCLLSAGVLHALLYLKVYSWCICGERYNPRPPTPPPSSVLFFLSFIVPILAWNVPLIVPVFLKRSLAFPILSFSSVSLHSSLRRLSELSLLVSGTVTNWVYLSLSLSLLPTFSGKTFCFSSFLSYL